MLHQHRDLRFELLDAFRLQGNDSILGIDARALLHRESFQAIHALDYVTHIPVRTGFLAFVSQLEGNARIHHRITVSDCAAKRHRRVRIRLEESTQRSGVGILVMAVAHREAPLVIRIKSLRTKGREGRRAGADFVDIIRELLGPVVHILERVVHRAARHETRISALDLPVLLHGKAAVIHREIRRVVFDRKLIAVGKRNRFAIAFINDARPFDGDTESILTLAIRKVQLPGGRIIAAIRYHRVVYRTARHNPGIVLCDRSVRFHGNHIGIRDADSLVVTRIRLATTAAARPDFDFECRPAVIREYRDNPIAVGRVGCIRRTRHFPFTARRHCLRINQLPYVAASVS